MTGLIVVIMEIMHSDHLFYYTKVILQGLRMDVKETYLFEPNHSLFLVPHQGGTIMADTIDQRACELAVYMIETGATVRSTANKFGISKSTVHKDIQNRLPKCNKTLYNQVRKVLERNKQERHIRGGMATKRKFQLK